MITEHYKLTNSYDPSFREHRGHALLPEHRKKAIIWPIKLAGPYPCKIWTIANFKMVTYIISLLLLLCTFWKI